jgi:glycosyltransferase involved in cell wall biosynthesis
MVTCRVSTFQQAAVIRQCLDGILMQITDFPVEILIGEDESTDGTREICIEYAQQYPERIRLFLHKRENNITIAGKPSGIFQVSYTRYMSRGKYLAICEGDDFWTDPYKLQKQVDFLEQHEDYGMVFTNLEVMRNERIAGFFHHPDIQTINTGIEALIVNNPVATHTVLYRKELLDRIQGKWEGKGWSMGDYPLWLEIAGLTKIHYLNAVTGVYRVSDGSASQHFSPFKRKEFLRDSRAVSMFYHDFYKLDDSLKRKINQRYFVELFNMAYTNRLPQIIDEEIWKNYRPEKLKQLIIYVIVLCYRIMSKKNLKNE